MRVERIGLQRALLVGEEAGDAIEGQQATRVPADNQKGDHVAHATLLLGLPRKHVARACGVRAVPCVIGAFGRQRLCRDDKSYFRENFRVCDETNDPTQRNHAPMIMSRATTSQDKQRPGSTASTDRLQ